MIGSLHEVITWEFILIRIELTCIDIFPIYTRLSHIIITMRIDSIKFEIDLKTYIQSFVKSYYASFFMLNFSTSVRVDTHNLNQARYFNTVLYSYIIQVLNRLWQRVTIASWLSEALSGSVIHNHIYTSVYILKCFKVEHVYS